MKTEIRINLNDKIKVKLTDFGKQIFYHRYDDINARCMKTAIKPSYPRQDKDGYTTFQLWDFIQLYGRYIGLGQIDVIDPIDMVYEAQIEAVYKKIDGAWVKQSDLSDVFKEEDE